MRALIVLLVLTASGAIAADSMQATAVVSAVISGAKLRTTDYRTIEKLFPATLVAQDYEVITRQLILDKLDLEGIGSTMSLGNAILGRQDS
jgi:hypothetical protein